MIPWILILIVPVIISKLRYKYVFLFKKKIDISFLLSYLILFIFRGFREDTVGGDLVTYKEAYTYLTELNWNLLLVSNVAGYETGYAIYDAVLNKISSDFHLEIFVTAIITTFCLLRFVYDNSKNAGLSLFIYIAMYYYGSTFNNERQSIAIGLLMLSVVYIKRRSLKKFIICVLLATTFHTTSLSFLIIYPLYVVPINKKYWLFAISGFISAFLLSKKVLSFLINGIYADKYGDKDLMAGGGYVYFAILLILLLATLVFMKRSQIQNPDRRIWIHMLVIGAAMQILSFEMGYFYRAVILFSVSMIFLIPEILNCMNDRSLAQFGKFVVIILLGAYYIYELAHDSIGVVPYKSILFD